MRLAMMNGWKEAPHHWKRFWRMEIARTPEWTSVAWLGFVVFLIRGRT